jgi:hypothetical protein
MKLFEVILTKSYVVTINADTEHEALELAEFFTDDVKDISTENDRKNYRFSIQNIDCKVNEALSNEQI